MIVIPSDIVIFGTRFEAEKVVYQHVGNGGRIKFIIDNFTEGSFHGLPICKLDDEKIKEYFIIVACGSLDTYKKIKDTLVEKGLKEYRNFVWSYICNKKIVVINANCHGSAVQKYLRKSREFNKEYIIYPLGEIQNNEAGEIDEKLLEVTDVYIHQDIQKDNKIGYKLSDEYIFSKLNPLCKCICIPNLVGFGSMIFQSEVMETYGVVGNRRQALFYRDIVIDEAYQAVSSEKSMNRIIQFISDYKFNKADVIETFENILKKLYQREKNWDIKIAKYIEEHYQNEKIFHDCAHPSDGIMLRICEQVADILEIKDIDKGDKIYFNMGIEAFVWPDIAKILGISNMENEVRQGDMIHILTNEDSMDVKEFIREYIWCFYNEYIM